MATGVTMACDQPAVRKGPWTLEEDLILVGYISEHGEGSWDSLARAAGLNRNGKSCRLRWLNYLRPGVRRGSITPAEDAVIRELHATLGNRWSKISKHLPGRTDNEIKNYWRTRIQKRQPVAAKAQPAPQPPAVVVSSSAAAAAGDFWCAEPDPGQQARCLSAAAATSQDSYTAGDYSKLLMSSVAGHGEAVGVDALTQQFFLSQFSDGFWNAVENFWETKPVTGAF
ncbi:unnamed protein product [Urochloa humidicola]